MVVDFHREKQVGYVVLNAAPVNAIGLAMRAGLIQALDWIDEQKDLSHVVLAGAGPTFAAGADAKEFDAAPVAPHLPDVIARIEACDIPWVAAISGYALGGGCELALGCRYRIAAPDAKIGLPEVTLGVVPGAGATQRLPRLIGIAAALEMISVGKPVNAQKAEQIGLIDGIADDPVATAARIDIGTLTLAQPISDLPRPTPNTEAVDNARRQATKKSAGQIAPGKAIDLVALSADLSFQDALTQERAAFIELREGAQAKALRHVFFAERGARAPDWLDAQPGAIDHVAVVGGGTMGSAIAYALLNAGLRVTLLETDADGVDRAVGHLSKIVSASLKRGLIDAAGAADRQARFAATEVFEDAKEANLVIEAAFESMEVKHSVFTALEAILPPDVVFATNTSYLDVNEIAQCLACPSRLVGLHFFAPAHIMKLLEIVRGDETSDHALATGFSLAKQLRKVPVLSGVCDGFIGNRILARYREAADTILMDGSTPWEIDDAMVAFGYAMGPYEAQDLSGLDIAHANRRRQDATRDPDRRYIPIADRMIELGKLGKKTGAGWYRYPGGGGKVEDPIVADLALEEAHFAGLTRVDYAPNEIRNRLLLAMINEAANILHEGIAASARDIDLVTVFGYGFPRFRGGLMHYADTLGAKSIVQQLRSLAQEDPLVWAPSPALLYCEETGATLAEYAPEQTAAPTKR